MSTHYLRLAFATKESNGPLWKTHLLPPPCLNLCFSLHLDEDDNDSNDADDSGDIIIIKDVIY